MCRESLEMYRQLCNTIRSTLDEMPTKMAEEADAYGVFDGFDYYCYENIASRIIQQYFKKYMKKIYITKVADKKN